MSQPPYRENQAPEEPEDPEHRAIAILAKRTRRVRSGVAAGSIIGGLVASAAIYDVFWSYYDARGLAIPLKMIAIASFTLGFLPALVAAPRVASLWVRARRGAWLDELAAANGLDRVQLDELTRSF